MMRALSLVLASCGTTAVAQDILYQDALALTVTVAEAEAENYYAAVGNGRLFTQMLESDGVLVHRGTDETLTLFNVELVATFDKATEVCAFGPDVPDHPNLPRTAAMATQQAGIDNNWGADTLAPTVMRGPECYVRSALASVAGELVMVYPLETDTTILYLGMPDLGRAP